MTDDPDETQRAAKRRKQAEELLAARLVQSDDADKHKVLHELLVHQIELEMQNHELRQARAEAEAAWEQYADLYDFAPVALLSIDRSSNIKRANHAAATLLGEARVDLFKMQLGKFVSPDSRPAFDTFQAKAFARGTTEGCEVMLSIQGRSVWAMLKAKPEASRQLLLVTIHDITEQKQAAEAIQKQAHYDTLTGLPNRQLFKDRLQQGIKKARRSGKKLALMFLDLDRFKEINDTLGHDMGDLLLQQTALRLSGCAREVDTVARLGGDEFTVILGDLDDLVSVERVADCILQSIIEPFNLGAELGYVSASIGIAVFPDDATDMHELLKYADKAMYAAKNQGRNRVCYFTPAMQEMARKRLELANELRQALAAHQFRVAYQPIVDLATGAIHKAEALLRWEHPQHGLIPPAAFIAVAEETGLLSSIGDWVFRQAAAQAMAWRTKFDKEFQISVNKSLVQFRSDDEKNMPWVSHLDSLGLDKESIVVEITEGLLMDANSKVVAQLVAFRDAGMPVSLDNFGTGYSALSAVDEFNIRYLKIDQSFVRDLMPDSSHLALCEAYIAMSHKLGLKVVAEGVETQHQRDLLYAAGCDYGQGYLFSRPLPAEEFEKLLQQA